MTFGTYEQDNNTANGAEPIEWIVLQSDKPGYPYVIAISKYILDAQPFHSEKGLITWEDCSLRTWLNNDFLTSAFTDEEIALLYPIYISTHDNPTDGLDCGNSTMDRVFLPCEHQTSLLTGRNKAPTTAYAQSKGLYAEDSWISRATVYTAQGVYVLRFDGRQASLVRPEGVRPYIAFYVGDE